MPTRSAKRQRTYSGPALFSVGFRPFFLLAGIWAALAMGLWIAMLAGRISLPSVFDPVAWHAHELIFGYAGAVVCGFLLTAIPNWTGRLPVTGAPLAVLAAIWVAGRIAVTLGEPLGAAPVALIDLAFPAALTAIVAREIIASGNRRNLPVLALCCVFLAGNAAFHWAAWTGGAAASAVGARVGIAALVILISLIGGRVVPSFTRNWLVKQAPGILPVPMGRFDAGVLGLSVVSLALWAPWPDQGMVGALLLLTGLAQLLRLARWAGWRCGSEPLVWILHLGYFFVPVGFLLVGGAIVAPDMMPATGALHSWLAGAVGLMTLAMMTRASLGHSGRALQARWDDTTNYLLILTATLTRIAAGFGGPGWLLHLAGGAWIAGFGLFAIAYWPVLTRPRLAPKQPSGALAR